MGNVSGPSNTVLVCAKPVQVQISGKKNGTRPKFTKSRCGECWQCTTTAVNKRLSRLLAECATVQRVELWTLTYGNDTAEARLGAKQRDVTHLQKWQKIVRQREKRGLMTYNRREKKAAKKEGRQPKLVNNNRSYCTFHPVFEFGSKNNRGHWHVIVFWHSHFPVGQLLTASNEPKVCPENATRVWDLARVIGPETEGIPPDANNPDKIDWRVRKGGSQKHSSWPHGWVNVECVSHDLRAVDYYGRSAPQRLPNVEIHKALRYTLKYLSKPDTQKLGKNVKPLTEQEKQAQTDALQTAKGGKRLYQTGSQGMGKAYATAWAQHLANAGVPMNNLHFRVDGVNMARSVSSMAKFEAKLSQRIQNPASIQSYLLDAQKVSFQMQGCMYTTAADVYLDIAQAKGMTGKGLGEIALQRQRQKLLQQKNEQLRSVEAQFQRDCTRELTKNDRFWIERLIANLSPCAQEMLDTASPNDCRFLRYYGPMPHLPFCILSPEPFEGYIIGKEAVPSAKALAADGITRRSEVEKLAATQEAIACVDRIYGRADWFDPFKYENLKKNASYWPDVGQEYLREQRLNVDAKTQEIYEANAADETLDSEERRLAQQIAQGRQSELLVEPWACIEHGIPANRRLAWLNYSEQYGFPAQRERHIHRYCYVQQWDKERRIIITPDGRVLFGAKRTFKANRTVILNKQRKVIKKKLSFNQTRYVYKEVHTIFDLLLVKSRHLPATLGPDFEPVFLDSLKRPFQVTWAMKPSQLHVWAMAIKSSPGSAIGSEDIAHDQSEGHPIPRRQKWVSQLSFLPSKLLNRENTALKPY